MRTNSCGCINEVQLHCLGLQVRQPTCVSLVQQDDVVDTRISGPRRKSLSIEPDTILEIVRMQQVCSLAWYGRAVTS